MGTLQNDSVEVANASSLQFSSGANITLSTWVRPSQNTGYGTFLVKGRDTVDNEANYAIRQAAAGKKLEFYYNESGNITWDIWESTNNIFLETNKWYYVALTYTFGTGSSIKVYIDGVEVPGSWTTGTGNAAPDLSSQVLTFGLKKNGTTEAFAGVLDDVRIYSRALSPEEVQRLYLMGK